MKADIVSFPKAPGRCGSDVHERGRLASKRDQQKWFPVLRLIALQQRTRDQQKWFPVLCLIALQQRTRDQQKWFPVLRPKRMALRILASPFWLAY
ncbi:hypothetical protein [Mesorhizobium sp. M0496]|uniref:hypothetical protein n=1 Tax=Mesorhizobium sp. M0496 TaxID=2956952 RepID=UPI00333C2D35